MSGDRNLSDEALRLVASARTNPSDEARGAVTEFRQRSNAHADAIEAANEHYAVLSGLPERRFTAAEQKSIRREALFARMTEPRRIGVGVASALLLAAIVVGVQSPGQVPTPPTSAVAVAPSTNVYRTQRQSRKVALADRSVLWLDWNSKVTVTYSESKRLVRLERGRAAFKVVSRADRPFVVHSGRMVMRVTGTEFVVDRRASTNPSVSVLEGSVETTASNTRLLVKRGERVELAHDVLRQTASGSVNHEGAWRDGRLVLRDASLPDAFLALEPYSSYAIDVSELKTLDHRVSGTYFTQSANDAVSALVKSYGLRVEQDEHRLSLSPKSRN